MKFCDFLKELEASLSRYCVAAICLRNFESFPSENIGADVDIAIDEGQLSLAILALSELNGVVVTNFVERAYVTTFFFWGVDEGGIQIDLVTRLSWKGIPYLDFDDVLERSAPIPGCEWIRKPSETHEAIVCFFSSYLVGGWIKERYQSRVSSVFSKHREACIVTLEKHFDSGLASELTLLVMKDDRDRLMSILPKIKRGLLKNSISTSIGDTLYKLLEHYISEIQLRISKRSLTRIALLGVDGSGKSTIVTKITERLSGCVKDVRVQHLKPRWRSRSGEGVSTDPHALPPRSDLVSLAKVASWVVAYWLQYFTYTVRNSELFVWDRYVYDVLADTRRYRVADHLISIVRLFSFLSPRLDSVIYIDVDPEIAYSRKQEVPIESIRSLRSSYLDLMKSLDGKNFVIENNGQLNNAVGELLQILVCVMNQKASARIEKVLRP